MSHLCWPSLFALLFFHPTAIRFYQSRHHKRRCHSLWVLHLPLPLTDGQLGQPALRGYPVGQPQYPARVASHTAPLHLGRCPGLLLSACLSLSLSLSLRLKMGLETNSPRPKAQGLSSWRTSQPLQRCKGRTKTCSLRALGGFFSPLRFSSKRMPRRCSVTTSKLAALRTFSSHRYYKMFIWRQRFEFHIFLLLFSTLNISTQFKLGPRVCYC